MTRKSEMKGECKECLAAHFPSADTLRIGYAIRIGHAICNNEGAPDFGHVLDATHGCEEFVSLSEYRKAQEEEK